MTLDITFSPYIGCLWSSIQKNYAFSRYFLLPRFFSQHSSLALVTLEKAIRQDPQNPLCKFHKASILFSSDRHHEALKELEELKDLVPRESLVYFLMGKVNKKLGNTHLALMNFSWAMDLDPKGANNQIKVNNVKRRKRKVYALI